MSTSAEEVNSTVLNPALNVLAASTLSSKRLRHRFARAVMNGIFLKNGRHGQPVLVKLRWQFDKVARYRCAGNSWPGDVRQKPVQRMAEFMKQCSRTIERKQSRLALGWLGEIHDVIDDWLVFAVELVLRLEARSSMRQSASTGD